MQPPGLSFELTRPHWLAGLIVLPLLYYYFRHSLVDFTRRQKAATLTLRATIVILLVLSLAGLTLLSTTREQFVVFAIDRSLSVGEESRRQAEAYVAKASASARAKNQRVATLGFGAEPGVVHTADDTDATRAEAPIDDKGTNLAAAIEVAAAAIPPFYVPQIVLLTDGNATLGDA